ncbi:MAG: hypothetical protein QW273_01000 [Candidatus Pacearchaeota archaeon]
MENYKTKEEKLERMFYDEKSGGCYIYFYSRKDGKEETHLYYKKGPITINFGNINYIPIIRKQDSLK